MAYHFSAIGHGFSLSPDSEGGVVQAVASASCDAGDEKVSGQDRMVFHQSVHAILSRNFVQNQ